MERGMGGDGRRRGGRWHRPEMNEEDGGAVSKFNLDAIKKEKKHKDLHMSKKSCKFARFLYFYTKV